jgi:hypothetical protein
MPLPVVLGVGAGVAALAWFWWRSRSAKGSSSTTSTTTSASTSTDVGEEIAGLQSEIDQLLGQGSGGGGGGNISIPGTTRTTMPATGPATSKTQKPFRPVTGMHTTDVTAHGAKLSWAGLPSASSYRLTVSHGTDVIHNSTETGRSFTLTGLKANTTYLWKVAGVNAGGQGPYGGPVTFHTKLVGGTANPGGEDKTQGKKKPVLQQ